MAKLADGPASQEVVETEDDSPRPAGGVKTLLFTEKSDAGQIKRVLGEMYLVPIDDASANQWASYLRDGLASEQDVTEYAKAQAAGLYPQFQKQILAGVAPSVLLSPFRNLAERELGREVTWDDRVMDGIYTLGEEATLNNWRGYIRQLPEWEEGPVAAAEMERLARKMGEL